jgi:hypothetical protein
MINQPLARWELVFVFSENVEIPKSLQSAHRYLQFTLNSLGYHAVELNKLAVLSKDQALSKSRSLLKHSKINYHKKYSKTCLLILGNSLASPTTIPLVRR